VQRDLQSGALTFPLIVKPRTGFGSSHTYTACNERQLDVFFHIGPPMIVQPRVCGADYDFDICNDLDEQPVSVVLWRKLKSTMGETENVVTVKNDALLEVGVRLGRAIGHVGPMDVDMFVNEQNEATIIEMNPRFGGGYPVSHLAGADFPRMLLRMLRGESVAPRIGDYAENTVMMKSLEVFGGPLDDFFARQLHLDDREAVVTNPR
jgi:carbamoyl-phosphate synthase large subunit